MNSEYPLFRQMLRPQDILVACKLLVLEGQEWTFSRLAGSLAISTGEIHNVVERSRCSRLITMSRGKLTVSKKRLFDLLTVAVPQIFYAVRGSLCLGVPTSVYAPCLTSRFPREILGSVPLVWPYPTGTGSNLVRGESLLALYPTAPRAVVHDETLYELLALVDVLRTIDSKERKLAIDFLDKLIWKGEKKQSYE